MLQNPPAESCADGHSSKTSFMKSRICYYRFFILGCVTMGLMHLLFVLFWRTYFSHFPLHGYRAAMEQGRIPPFFTNSTPGLWFTMSALFPLPVVAFWFACGRPRFSVLAMWAGVMFAIILIWVSTPQLRHDSNLWPLDLVFLSFMTGIPIFLGDLLGAAIQKIQKT